MHVGCAAHPGWTNTSYTDVDRCFTVIDALGIKSIRGLDPGTAGNSAWLDRAAPRGVAFTIGTDGNTIPGDTFKAQLDTLVTGADAKGVRLLAVEGANEPDAKGAGWQDFTLRHQTALWQIVRELNLEIDVLGPAPTQGVKDPLPNLE